MNGNPGLCWGLGARDFPFPSLFIVAFHGSGLARGVDKLYDTPGEK